MHFQKLEFVKGSFVISSWSWGKQKKVLSTLRDYPSSNETGLQLLHMDLCGPMRVESINGKKYVLVIVDDYSRYTWTHFLRSKDETPGVLIDFLTLVQRGLHAQVTTVRTDKGTEFLNKTLHAYFAKEGIRHETSTARTPEQNGVVERRNRTLVEAARTMLSAAKVPLFFWAEAIATACFTQNRSLVIPRHEKTPYHIINARKPSVKFFHIFGSLCYIVRDGENLDKNEGKGVACNFCGYSTQSKEELHQFDRLDVWEIKSTGGKALVQMDVNTCFLLRTSKGRSVRKTTSRYCGTYHHDKVLPSQRKHIYGLKQAQERLYDESPTSWYPKGFSKGSIDPILVHN
ncbi:retrovirus-related pol polyprotein from transposon TNT 1-94 [Tanacetum coccineum]|uniref:Retrovirus-related pol polyprotein from transposon TNT 1-94 n=1 Tax=Tanacetum coccineum TaxID=301880 RepID=A0ABQ5FRI1_9ASTR